MRLNRLDLNLLITLDALLTEKSITRAAERIHLSQPATSSALSRLREYFEDDLLVRIGSQMQPTPLGESLATPVHNILLQIQATVERKPEFNAIGSNRSFKFQTSDYSQIVLMNHVAKKIESLAPKTQIDFLSPIDQPASRLEKGEADFLILPDFVLAEDHPWIPLFDDRIVCLGCNNNTTLANGMSLEEFSELGHVVVKFGASLIGSHEMRVLKELHNIEPHEEVITWSFSAIPYFLQNTQRITITFEHIAKKWAELYNLKIVDLPLETPNIRFSLQWHKYRDSDPSIQWLRKIVEETANEIIAR